MKKSISSILLATLLVSSISLPSMADGVNNKTALSSGLKKAVKQLQHKAPLNKEFVKYTKAIKRGLLKSEAEAKNGLIPAPLKPQGSVKVTQNRGLLGLPAKYDLREKKRVTPIRDQGPNGSCWAFAAYGSLESTLLPNENDFSEKNMRNTHGFDAGPEQGGHRYMSTAYMARWSGPISEENDPYSPTDFYSRTDFDREKDLIRAVFLPDVENHTENMDIIKNAIMKNGAVQSSVLGSPKYLNPRTNAHYNHTNKRADHAITLVGWDDNFSKNNFLKKPAGDGAWLVKNSWGPSFGDGGYYWVSYYDNNIAKSNAQYFAQDKGEFEKIYQYDPLGVSDQVGEKSGYFANVFKTGKAAEKINAVGLVAPNNNVDYKVYLVKNYVDENSFTDRIQVAEGHFDFSGYYVVKFDDVEIPANTKFAPVIYYEGDGDYCIPVETVLENYTSRANSKSGQSYTSADGKAFVDLTTVKDYEKANVCVKAFSYGGVPVEVEGVSFDTPERTAKVGQTITLDPTIKPYDAANKKMKWKCSDETVLKMVKDGSFRVLKEGTATVTVTTVDGNKTATCKVTVEKAEEKTLTLRTTQKKYFAGDRVVIVSRVIDKKGRGILGEKVKISIGNYTQEVTTGYMGRGTLTLLTNEKIPVDKYPVVAELKDNFYKTAETSFDIVEGKYPVEKKMFTLSTLKPTYTPSEKMEFYALLKDENGKEMKWAKTFFEVTDEDGKVEKIKEYTDLYGESFYSREIKKSDIGKTFTVVATTKIGEEELRTEPVTVTVKKDGTPDPQPEQKPQMTISCNKTDYELGQHAKVVANFQLGANQPITNQTVKLLITKPNGKNTMRVRKTDGEGNAYFTVDFTEEGTYSVKAQTRYDYKNIESKPIELNVVKPEPTYAITVSSDKDVYKYSSFAKFTAEFKDSDNNKIAGKEVTFEIMSPNGKIKTKTKTTNEEGIASIMNHMSRFNGAGNYQIIAKAVIDNEEIVSPTHVVKVEKLITPKPAAESKELTVEINNSKAIFGKVNLFATVADANGSKIKNARVRFLVVDPEGNKTKIFTNTNIFGKANAKIKKVINGTYKVNVKVTHDNFDENVQDYTFEIK